MALTLRQANSGDTSQVARLFRHVRETALPYLPNSHTPEEDQAYFRDHVFKDCSVWVATDTERPEELLGFSAFREGWIDHLYVDPTSSGRGIGTALLKVAEEAYSDLQLWTFQRNLPAIRFYEARGFKMVQQTDGAENEEHEPDALYEWSKGTLRLIPTPCKLQHNG